MCPTHTHTHRYAAADDVDDDDNYYYVGSAKAGWISRLEEEEEAESMPHTA